MCPACLLSVSTLLLSTGGVAGVAGAALSVVTLGRRMNEPAEIVHDHVPIDEQPIHGVTFDGARVWFARSGELVAFDPARAEVVARLSVPGAGAGTAFDGEHLYQLAGPEILVVRRDGAIVRRLPAPAAEGNSGMAWSDGFLWIGRYRDGQILKVDAKDGRVVRTLVSDRFVTGVSCVDGDLWHATGKDEDDGVRELRRLDEEGNVVERHEVRARAISGLEAAGDGFWCGGEQGHLRFVRPRRRR